MFIIGCIILNIIILALPFEGMTPTYAMAVYYAHYGIVLIFMIEAFLKIISLGFIRYIINPWNKYDLITACVSAGSFLLTLALG
jgi:Ion transport protein